MDVNQEHDEIAAVLPIHFTNTLAPNVHLYQYPLLNRSLQVPPSAQLSGKRISARIKPEVRRMELHVPADTRPEVWNIGKARDLGTAQFEDDAERSQDVKSFSEGEEPRLNQVRLQSEQIPQRGAMMLGIVRNGKLNLHPIHETHQFRPSLTYLDVLSRRNKRTRHTGSESESDEGPPPDPAEPTPAVALKKEKKAAGPGKEVQVSARKTDDKGGGLTTLGGLTAVRREMLRAIRMEEEEEWQDLQFHDISSSESTKTFESIFSQNTDSLSSKDDITLFLKEIKGL